MTPPPPPGPDADARDRVRASVVVRVPPDHAFELFTARIDEWWRRGPRWRQLRGAAALMAIEPGVGGRVYESIAQEEGPGDDRVGDGIAATGSAAWVVDVGRVTVWQPPLRFAFTWRASNFADSESTWVDVVFEAVGDDSTRVTVTHGGWAAIRADHPVRHGLQPRAFLRERALAWSGLLMAYRARAELPPT